MKGIILLSILYIVIEYLINISINIIFIERVYPAINYTINGFINWIDRAYNRFINLLNYNDYERESYINYDNIYKKHYNGVNKEKLEYINSTYKDNNIKMLSSFTCPICYNIYESVFICPNGHSLCSECFESHKDCPFCRSTISQSSRNRVMEEMMESIELPCSYYLYGCKKCLKSSDRKKHELKCKFKPWKCTIDGCIHKCNKKDNIEHIKNKHSKYEIVALQKTNDNIYKTTIIFNLNTDMMNKINTMNTSNLIKILNIKNNLYYIKWYIQTCTFNVNTRESKALCLSLISTSNNKFSMYAYNNEISDFGKYNIVNKIKNKLDYCNTLVIPLDIILNNTAIDKFNIDINIYEKCKKYKMVKI